VFRSEWHLAAPATDVYRALADVERYPRWWPQVRDTRRIDDTAGELTCRSLMPHDLVFVMRREIEDPASGLLRAVISGDLVGTGQWTITANGSDGTGTLAVFDEDVSVGHGLVQAAGPFFRPLLRLSHDHMMRSGEKGLQAHLSADGGV
jgi:uncharacterized protein YndB with AHSA1/START domain